LDIV
jgi:hypothetical protein